MKGFFIDRALPGVGQGVKCTRRDHLSLRRDARRAEREQ
jgi:hypothetical protein